MTEPKYRLQTDEGLSRQYTLQRLLEKRAAGVVDVSAQCTADDGDSFVSLAQLMSDEEGLEKPATPDPVNSESSTIAQSETSVDINVDSTDDEADQSEDDEQSLRSQSRRLRRLPAGSGNGKLTRLKAAREERKAAGQITGPDDLIGVSLANDRYKIVAKLGKGSMAYVLRASDSRLLTDVVVKVPKPEKMTDADIRDRFRRESQLLVQLTHPHVVKVLDVGEYHDLPYVVMQLLSGGTLTDLIKNGSVGKTGMAADSLKTWLREVARALDFCYRKGMVHRDVKPANILFDEDKNAYVSDFGLTKIMYGDHDNIDPSDTASGIVLGTPNYISPEIVLGRGYDGRADQYSLGITVYHALFGKAPMQGDNATATMINQTQKQLQLLSDIRSDIPRELALAVRKSIEKKPENRFDTCEEFADAVLEGLRAPLGGSTATTVVSTEWASPETSSQSSVRRRQPGKNSKSSRSGRLDAAPAAPDPDMEWLDISAAEAAPLPPRTGKSKPARPKKTKKTAGATTQIFGHEVHPGLVIALSVGVAALVLSIIIRWAMSPDDDETRFTAGVTTDTSNLQPEDAASASGHEAVGGSTNQNVGGKKNGNQGNKKNNGATSNAAVSPQTPVATEPDNSQNDATQDRGYSSGIAATTPNDTTEPVAPATSVPATATTELTKPKTAVTAAPTPAAVNTDDASTIPFAADERVIFGPVGCPVIVVGNKVWNKATKTVSSTLEGDIDGRAYAVLSSDGKLFAAASKVPNLQDTDVIVWDTANGKRLFTAKGTGERYTDAILLSSKKMYVGGRWTHEISVWDCTNGTSKKAIDVPGARFEFGNAAISHDGEFVAMISNNHLGVVRTGNGKIAAAMRSPEDRPRNNKSAASGSDNGNEAVYTALRSLSFSSDGTLLAGVSTQPQSRVLCWNGQGELLVDRTLSVRSDAPEDNTLEWFPDGSSWLIGGNIVDKESGRTLLVSQRRANGPVGIYDENHLCGVFSGTPDKLSMKEISWTSIRESLANIKNSGTAVVSPSQPVGIQVSIENRQDLQSPIQKALTKRLAADGISIDESVRNRTFRVSGGEGSSDLTIDLIVDDQPVWQTKLDDIQLPARNAANTNDADRNATLDKLESRINGLVTPYFVPKDSSQEILPVVFN